MIVDDDSSSTLSAREEFLLVLVSSLLESSGQMKNQKRALMILEACGVQPEVLDAADPANDIVREELFEMSGIRGVFPQFFLVQGDQTSFFANFTELDNMNEEGILEEWLNMEFPSVKKPVNVTANADAGADTNVSNELKLDVAEYNHVQNTSTTTDFFNVASDTKILKSAHDVPDVHHYKQQQQQQHECLERETISSIPTAATQEEWSDPLLLERYEDEILALENFLQKREQKEGPQNIQKNSKQAITNEEDERVRAEQEVPSSTNRENEGEQRSFHNKMSKQHIISSADAAMDKQQMKQEEDTSSECFYETPKLQSMQSLISSDDDDAETTATKSSTLMMDRVISSDLDLRIQPETDIHFWLNDETPRCTITLSNLSSSNSPLAFKINSSENRRYMVHPIVGIIKPQTTVPITIFLLDEAKEKLLSMFRKLESTADFQQNDKLSIEWCAHHPTNYCNKLTGNYDQDFDTLLSYWDSARNNDMWSLEKSFLPIKINNVDEKGYDNISPHRHRQSLHLPPLSPSTATTATITPTSSSSPSSRSQEKHYHYSTKNCNSPSLLQINNDYNDDNNNNNNNDIPINVSMETFSTRSETEQLLQAEVECFRQKCEELTAERYIVEGQLKEAREKEERSSLSRCNGRLDDGIVHKFQLQQMMRCGYCLKVFKSALSSLNAPIASNACGHSICRNCCHERLSSSRKVRRRRRNENMDSSERLRSTISSDLFMCVGDINQVYSSSFDDENDVSESCPICHTSRAFRHGKLHANESLCVVLKLLEG